MATLIGADIFFIIRKTQSGVELVAGDLGIGVNKIADTDVRDPVEWTELQVNKFKKMIVEKLSGSVN